MDPVVVWKWFRCKLPVRVEEKQMLQSANVEFLADICTLFGGHQEAYKLETNWRLLLDQHIGKSKGFGVDGWGGVWYLA